MNRKGMGVSILLLVLGMLSIQLGATIAKQLFPIMPPAVITMIRTGFAAAFLLIILRPKRMNRAGWRAVACYGGTLGIMNLFFYLSLQRIPLGIAVALEFIGPLGVALFGSRRALDLVWVALAAFGIFLLLPFGVLNNGLDPLGVILALTTGVCWGLYIVFGKRVGALVSMQQATGWGMVFAALAVLPFGLHEIDWSVATGEVLWGKGILVAILSSAIPYSLEMIVLKRMDLGTFGTLMSIEPVLGAGMGFLLLGEVLSLQQSLAMAAIVVACLGATLANPRNS